MVRAPRASIVWRMGPVTELPAAAAAGLPRRRFLQGGLLGGALLALGGGTLALRATRLVPTPPEGLLVLSPGQYAVVDAFVRRMVPPRPGFPTHEEVRTAFNADRILAGAEAGAQEDFRTLLDLFESALAGLLLTGRTAPFTRLSPEAQDAVIADWRDSGLVLRRTGYHALRALAAGAYYGSPRVWPAVGYPGPPSGLHDPDAPVWKGGGVPRPRSAP